MEEGTISYNGSSRFLFTFQCSLVDTNRKLMQIIGESVKNIIRACPFPPGATKPKKISTGTTWTKDFWRSWVNPKIFTMVICVLGLVLLYSTTQAGETSSSIPFLLVREAYVSKLTWISYVMCMVNYFIRQRNVKRKKELLAL